MIERVRDGVVRIEAGDKVGSGVIFEENDHSQLFVLTNAHVIEGVPEHAILVSAPGGSYLVKVLGVDHMRDLAVLRIHRPDSRPPILPFGDAPVPGDQVVAMGYALGISGEATVTQGIVSAVRYDASTQRWLIQTDAAISPGNSGGPLLNMKGEVVGINTFVLRDARGLAEGLGFAVSVDTVKERLSYLMTPGPRPTATSTPDSGYLFGPQSGELYHDPGDGFVKSAESYPRVNVRDIEVEATFFNPYVGTFDRGWDCGFFIRYGTRFDLRIVVHSERYWRVLKNIDYIAGGQFGEDVLNMGTGHANHVRFVAQGDEGTLYVNSRRVGTANLSNHMEAGRVLVGTGFFSGSAREGAVTRYEGFKGKRP